MIVTGENAPKKEECKDSFNDDDNAPLSARFGKQTLCDVFENSDNDNDNSSSYGDMHSSDGDVPISSLKKAIKQTSSSQTNHDFVDACLAYSSESDIIDNDFDHGHKDAAHEKISGLRDDDVKENDNGDNDSDGGECTEKRRMQR